MIACSAFGQGSVGTIAGTVTDPSGAAIPGASVTAINVDTNVKTKAVTNADGYYVILQLPPGQYDLETEMSGFKKTTQKGVRLQVADKLAINVRLEMGSLSESVSVTAEAPQLRTEDAQVGEVINSLMIQNLPQINRNPLELLRLAGNVAGDGTVSGNGSDTRINGGRTSGIEYLVDGATIMTGKFHSVASGSIPTMESVAEFKVITNGIAAEYGRASGGIVELATKGGTNELHGQFFEYFHNELLNANSWSQNWSSTFRPGKKAERMKFRQNDYGFQIGGPVILPKTYDGRNRTFWLFNFEQMKYRQAASNQLGIAPTAAERNGDMTGLTYDGTGPLMYDPMGAITQDSEGRFIKTTLLGGDGKHVPAGRIDPLAKRIMSYMPQPNRTPTPGYSQQNAFMGQSGYSQDMTDWNVRLDHNITDNHRLNMRFNRDHWKDRTSEWFSPLAPADGSERKGSLTGQLAWTWTITPTLLANVRASVMHHPNHRNPTWEMSMADWEIDPLMKTLTRNMPNVNWRTWSANQDGWGAPLASDMTFQSLDNFTNQSVVASISKIYGKHTVKTGFEHRRYQDHHWEDLFGTSYYGTLAVHQQNYGDPTWNNFNQSAANSWGSFLLGIPDNANKQAVLALGNASNYYAAYLQDDIKLTPKLTVNVGLRWDMESPMSERHDKIFAWDEDAPSAYKVNTGWNWNAQLAKAGLSPAEIASLPTPGWAKAGAFPNGRAFYAGTSEHPSRLLQSYHPWQFAPRLGAAYEVTSKTVLRGSFAIMYLTKTGNYWDAWVVGANRASSNSTDRNPLNGNIDHNNRSLFYPDQFIAFERSNIALDRTFGNIYGNAVSAGMRPPKEYSWSFSIQRQLPSSMLLEATYNGNHSGDLSARTPTSPFPAELVDPKYSRLFQKMVENPAKGQIQNLGLYSGDEVPLGILMLENPVWGGLTIGGRNIGRANYNALNLRLEKRMSHGVTFLVNYTFSKSLDNVGGVDGQGYKNYQSYQGLDDIYGYSPYDETHRLTFYHDVQFPLGKGRRFLGSPSGTGMKVLDGILGGWEYAGTAIIRSGRPISFVPRQGDVSQYSGVGSLWGQITGDMMTVSDPKFNSNSQLLHSGLDPSEGVRRFDETRFTQPQDMVKSNVPPIFPWIRHPGSTVYDGSLMKNFPMFREGTYMQFRLEAENLLNIRGFGPYNTQYGDPNFGFITSAGRRPRNMQISARFVF